MRILLYLREKYEADATIVNWVASKGYDLIEQTATEVGRTSSPELFELDLLLLEEAFLSEPEWLQEIRRAGRPVVVMAGKTEEELVKELEAASLLPRSNYEPIDCGYYDYFEAAIVQRRAVELRYLLPDGQECRENTRLRDLKTAQSEEFVQLADGRWLRLDRIRTLDGIVNTGEVCLISPR